MDNLSIPNYKLVSLKYTVFDKMYTVMDFSNWLIEQMNKRGWNQAELARRAGIPRQLISNYVNRQRKRPDDDVLIAIARAFNLPPETVFRVAGLLPPVPPDTEYETVAISLRCMVKHYLSIADVDLQVVHRRASPADNWGL